MAKKYILEIKNSISHMRVRHFAGLLYLCILVTVVSFYMKNGYHSIGEDKYNAFKYISLVGIPVWLGLRVIDFFIRKEWKEISAKVSGWRPGRYFIVLFLVISVISALTSNYRKQALFGSIGWNMGLLTIAMVIAVYFITEDIFRHAGDEVIRLFVGYCIVIVSLVLILGILNRYSIFIKRPKGKAEDYISTLGNINWFCGYLSVWAGIICGLFFSAKDNVSLLVRGALVWISAMAFVSCGADSAYLAWAAISLVSFVISLDKADQVRQWALMQAIAVSSLPCIRVIGWMRPYRMWYSSDWLQAVTYGTKWIVPFVVYTAVCVILAFAADFLSRHAGPVRAVVIAVPLAMILGIIFIIILNTVISGGIWPVRDHRIFYFDTGWGNGRGGIWRATVEGLLSMDPFYIFFGVGCDCYSSYIYSITSVAVALRKQFGTDLFLTNAHCEFLTMLVNEGIFGVIAYGGIFIAHIRDAIGNLSDGGLGMGVVLAVAAYIAIGTVGFMHILSTPFIFMALGMLAGLTNRGKLNTIS